jgi:hypothetical protein
MSGVRSATRLYGGNWDPPRRCGCKKLSYPDEAVALAAAQRSAEVFDTAFRVYKCPGHNCWHLATRGFHPRALKSNARILAWHISARGVISRDWLLGELGLSSQDSKRSSRGKRLFRILQVFADLGLIRLDDPRPAYVKASDYDGLRRVMEIGLEEYVRVRGIDVTGGAGPAGSSRPPGYDDPQPRGLAGDR